MFELNEDLKEMVAEFNRNIKEKYGRLIDMDKKELQDLLEYYIGDLKRVGKMTKEELKKIEEKGGVVGVDGSVNKKGGAYPHYVEIYQALAKSTLQKKESIYLSDVYSPIMKDLSFEDEMQDERSHRLADIEVRAAIESAKKHEPYVIMMDGGLIRYNIEAGESWGDLVNICLENNIILMGVIKDIKTSIISKELVERRDDFTNIFYDREVLFGKLDSGQVLFIDDDVNTKDPDGYSSAFLRSSLDPSIVGIDMLQEQNDRMEEMARLVYSLTPENSRGVPLWLDIVDKEAKISDKMMEALLEEYLDRDLYERFFVSERDKRS